MRGAFALAALLVALHGTARADSPAELAARKHFATAQQAFEHARYAEALAEYQESYRLSQYPAILYKIALCQDQLGNFKDAIAAYRQYLDADPKSDRRAGVEDRIARLEAQTAAPPAAAAPEPSPAPVAAPPAPVAAPPAPVAAAPAATPTAAPAPESPRRTPAYKKWWVWTIVGAGVAAVGLGVGLGVGLSSGFSPNLGTYSNGLRF